MDYLSAVIQALSAGLSLWNTKESRRIQEMAFELEQKIISEKKKPVFIKGMDPNGNYKNDDVIDNCTRQLLLLCKHFADSVKGANKDANLPG